MTPRSMPSIAPRALAGLSLLASLVAGCGGAPTKGPGTPAAGGAARTGGAPVTLSIGVGKEGEANAVTVTSNSPKKVTEICYSAPFEKNGQPRLFFWCDDVSLAPGATTQVVACSTCSTELPQLGAVTLERAKLEGGERWFRRATAAKPANGAPLATRAVGRHDWDEVQTGGPQPLYEVVNVGVQAITYFSYTCRRSDGGETGGSVTPNDPIEPGEIAYFTDAATDCRVTSAGFEKGEWSEEAK